MERNDTMRRLTQIADNLDPKREYTRVYTDNAWRGPYLELYAYGANDGFDGPLMCIESEDGLTVTIYPASFYAEMRHVPANSDRYDEQAVELLVRADTLTGGSVLRWLTVESGEQPTSTLAYHMLLLTTVKRWGREANRIDYADLPNHALVEGQLPLPEPIAA